MTDEDFMRAAIGKALEGIKKGQLPFGTCIVKDGQAISCAYNTILRDNDVTAHAEINAIRGACKKLGTLDLSGCTAYCTCEPCPMCLGALGLAGINAVIYGIKVREIDLEGFIALDTPESLSDLISNGSMKVWGGVLVEENRRMLREWEKRQST